MRMSVHSDEATHIDKLNRGIYAEAFARLAESCETPLVIGLYGSWGTGKTSLMKMIERNLDPEKSRSVWFDPWQHQFDETPSLALLHTMVDTFGMQSEAKKLMTVIAAAFGSLFLKVTTTLNIKDIDELGRRYEEERFEIRESRVRLNQHFRTLIEKAQYHTNSTTSSSANRVILLKDRRKQLLNNIRRAFQSKKMSQDVEAANKLSTSIDSRRRIIFFIDDLDRCSSSTVLSMLEALKLQLNIPGCVYFLGMDRVSIEKILKEHYKDSEFSEDSYLDKIVQLPFSIPPIAPGSIQQFIDPLLSSELRRCRSLLIRGLGDNPRHVKRFINTLALNHELAKSLQIEGYDPLILALLLLIQYRKSSLYSGIANDAGLLARLIEEQEEAKPEGIYRQYVASDAKLREVLLAAKGKFPSKIIGIERYIYLTQSAPVIDAELRFKGQSPGVEAAKAIALSGNPDDVDFLMMALDDEADFLSTKTIDYALGLVSTDSGLERIKYYLADSSCKCNKWLFEEHLMRRLVA